MEPPVVYPTCPQNFQIVFLCRTCNVTSPNCWPLFEQFLIGGKITTPAKVLAYCTGLKSVETEDFLPQHICPKCMDKMQSAQQFKQSVHEMDRMMRQNHLDLSTQSASESTSDGRLLSENGEHVIEEDFCELIEEYFEEEMKENREITEAENMEQLMTEIELEDILTTDEQWENQELQPLEQEVEGAEPKNWIEIGESETELIEEDLSLFEAIEESEETEDEDDPPIAFGSDSPKPAKKSNSHRSQTQNQTLQCPICSKQLSTRNSLKCHMQLHDTATPYVCHICCRSFKTRNALDGHMTQHDPNNPHRCPTCNKVYRQGSSLRSHMLTHTGVKPFWCYICGKRLTQKSGYKKHLLTHSEEKPHVCDICGRRFRFLSNMIAHRRSHNPVKPHQCYVCLNRSFGSLSELNRHIHEHNSEQHQCCGKCSKCYKRQLSLSLHQQSQKGDQRKNPRLL